jgi:hypothetical protein
MNLPGRPLTPDEAREVTHMGRRIAALILLQAALDKNYQAVKSASIPLRGTGKELSVSAVSSC